MEKLRYDEYSRTETKKSEYIPGLDVPGKTILYCPRCSTILEDIEHSKSVSCPMCNIYMERWGNALMIGEK